MTNSIPSNPAAAVAIKRPSLSTMGKTICVNVLQGRVTQLQSSLSKEAEACDTAQNELSAVQQSLLTTAAKTEALRPLVHISLNDYNASARLRDSLKANPSQELKDPLAQSETVTTALQKRYNTAAEELKGLEAALSKAKAMEQEGSKRVEQLRSVVKKTADELHQATQDLTEITRIPDRSALASQALPAIELPSSSSSNSSGSLPEETSVTRQVSRTLVQKEQGAGVSSSSSSKRAREPEQEEQQEQGAGVSSSSSSKRVRKPSPPLDDVFLPFCENFFR